MIFLSNLIKIGADLNHHKELSMILKTSPFSILNKERKELEYIKGVYKRRVQAEIDSYNDPEDEDMTDTIQVQDS